MGKNNYIFLPPPFTSSYITYQDVNADPKLRKSVTDHFHEKVLESLKNDDRFKKLSSKKKLLESDNGYWTIYKVLKHYTKKYNLNWYDLRPTEYITLGYIAKKLPLVLK